MLPVETKRKLRRKFLDVISIEFEWRTHGVEMKLKCF